LYIRTVTKSNLEVSSMKRKIVAIDREKCNGCGLCVNACHEGALELVDGKATLVSEDYCDGLGACLPECPAGAITIEEREAAAFDEAAVKAREAKGQPAPEPLACGCPGTHAHAIKREPAVSRQASPAPAPAGTCCQKSSELRQWPCQIKLVPVGAPYFEGADLLIAADCVAFAYASVHEDFMKGKITLIGCPKLDDVDYSEKLAAILAAHEVKSVTVLRMEVPCCGGLVSMVKRAMLASEKLVPWQVVTISTEGEILP
jgi:ferredoxin